MALTLPHQEQPNQHGDGYKSGEFGISAGRMLRGRWRKIQQHLRGRRLSARQFTRRLRWDFVLRAQRTSDGDLTWTDRGYRLVLTMLPFAVGAVIALLVWTAVVLVDAQTGTLVWTWPLVVAPVAAASVLAAAVVLVAVFGRRERTLRISPKDQQACVRDAGGATWCAPTSQLKVVEHELVIFYSITSIRLRAVIVWVESEPFLLACGPMGTVRQAVSSLPEELRQRSLGSGEPLTVVLRLL